MRGLDLLARPPRRGRASRRARVAEEGVVVEVELGVERQQVALAGDDQRVDLGERAVELDEQSWRAPTKNCRGLGSSPGRQAERRARASAAWKGCRPMVGANGDLDDLLGVRWRRPPRSPCRLRWRPSSPDAATRGRRRCRGRAPGRSSSPSRSQTRRTSLPSGPVWCVTSVLPRISLRGGSRPPRASLHDLDAAGLAAAAGVDLRLDHRPAALFELARHSRHGCSTSCPRRALRGRARRTSSAAAWLGTRGCSCAVRERVSGGGE